MGQDFGRSKLPFPCCPIPFFEFSHFVVVDRDVQPVRKAEVIELTSAPRAGRWATTFPALYDQPLRAYCVFTASSLCEAMPVPSAVLDELLELR
jgi:hypothetical protein